MRSNHIKRKQKSNSTTHTFNEISHSKTKHGSNPLEYEIPPPPLRILHNSRIPKSAFEINQFNNSIFQHEIIHQNQNNQTLTCLHQAHQCVLASQP